MDKKSLRGELISKLSSLPSEALQSLSFSLTHQLIKLFEIYPELQGQIGAGYLPLKAEIAPVYQELLRSVPLNLSYPVLLDEQMLFGLPQGLPKGTTWLESPNVLVEPQWLLIPGVGFDLKGSRLGRGGGYYDQYLSERDVIKIGLAWTEQIMDKIPMESHDSQMDFIITEKYCWDVDQQKRL